MKIWGWATKLTEGRVEIDVWNMFWKSPVLRSLGKSSATLVTVEFDPFQFPIIIKLFMVKIINYSAQNVEIITPSSQRAL